MKVARDGGHAYVVPGDPVPEASSWPNRVPWIMEGFIEEAINQLTVNIETDLELMHLVENELKKEEDIITVSL